MKACGISGSERERDLNNSAMMSVEDALTYKSRVQVKALDGMRPDLQS